MARHALIWCSICTSTLQLLRPGVNGCVCCNGRGCFICCRVLHCCVQVPSSAPAIGGQRFLDLAQGKEGVGFRKTKFELSEDGFVQDSGLKALSYQASGRTAITGG